jgi:GTP-binding protein
MAPMTNRYQNAAYLTAAADLRGLPPDAGFEVAFAGRSNAGKSSAINALCRRNGLARTSKTPGRTRLIQLFRLDDQRRLVDLPGYGFANVPLAVKQQWGRLIEGYLNSRECLRGLVLMVDIRHPLKDSDRQMLAWAGGAGMPIHVLLTKADKLSRGAAAQRVREVREELKRAHAPSGQTSVQAFSALRGLGLEEALACLDGWFDWPEPGATDTETPTQKEGPIPASE